MAKYEIYQHGKVQSLTVIKAKDFLLDINLNKLKFTNELGYTIAIFNWNNISGFKKLEE